MKCLRKVDLHHTSLSLSFSFISYSLNFYQTSSLLFSLHHNLFLSHSPIRSCICQCLLHTHDRSRLRQLDTTAVHLLQKVREGLKRSQGYSGSRAEEGNDIEVIASKYKNGIPPEVCCENTSCLFCCYFRYLVRLKSSS